MIPGQAAVCLLAYHLAIQTAILGLASIFGVAAGETPTPSDTRLTQLIAETRDDSTLALAISRLELTGRLAESRVMQLLPKLPGQRSRDALRVIADESAFLDAPTRQIVTAPAPDLAEQRRIVGLAVSYVTAAMHHLPNFFAVQTTTRFESQPRNDAENGRITAPEISPRLIGTMDATVTYRNGNGIDSDLHAKKRARQSESTGLRTWGLFGPVLAVVLHDASTSTFTWSHWETRDAKAQAVFRYKIPYENSNYHVTFCCAPDYSGFPTPIDRRTAYHGEVVLDPETGAILHLTLQSDLDQADLSTGLQEAALGNPLTRADLAVDYGSVDIGDKSYICPLHAVAVSQAHSLAYAKTGKQSLGVTLGPEKRYVNDSTFEKYHLFRSESRILPASSE